MGTAAADLEHKTRPGYEGWEANLDKYNGYLNDGARLIVDYPQCFSNSAVYDAKRYLGYSD